jgi:hypothetical protein
MRSHDYQITARQFRAIVLPPLGGLIACALLLHALASLDWLPQPATEHLPDLTVLGYQSQAARTTDAATVVLTGDSACLTGVDARALGQQLPSQPRVRNLGLVAGISLASYGGVVKRFIATNPGQVRAVVVLVSPGKVTGRYEDTSFETLWRELMAGQLPESASVGSHQPWRRWTGLALFEERLLAHWLVRPLRHPAGERFGFPRGLREHLAAHDGSGLDTSELVRPARHARVDLTLGPEFLTQSRALRAGLPEGVRLLAGLTPVPEGLPEPDYRARRDAALREWGEALGADALLLELPATLPDGLFASGVHLNERGQLHFTRLLASSLAARLPASPASR